MQQPKEAGPTPSQDPHTTAQLRGFTRSMDKAERAAGERNQAAALKALDQAATALSQLAAYLHRKAQRGRRPDLRPVNQPLGAARGKISSGSWGEAVPQIRQMRDAGLEIIQALAVLAFGAGTTDGATIPEQRAGPPARTGRRGRSMRRHANSPHPG